MATPRHSLRRLLLAHELAFLVLVAAAGTVGALWGVFWQQTSSESVRLNGLAQVAQEIRANVHQQLRAVAIARLRDDPAAESLFDRYGKQVKEDFNVLRRNSASRAEDYAIQAMQQAYVRIQAEVKSILGDSFLANRVVRSQLLDPTYEESMVGGFEAAYANFDGLVGQALDLQREHIRRWTRIAPWALAVPLAIAILLLIVSRRSLQRHFVGPMRQLVASARLLGAGDVDPRLPESGAQEVRELTAALNQMAAALAASRDRLVESERQAALGALVPVVAHNVRNPLASIRATAQLIPHAADARELDQIRRDLMETVDRLGRWINALVGYLHPLRPNLRPVSAVKLVDAGLKLLEPRLGEKSLRVERAPWNDELEIQVDPDLMEQALYGLLTNAVEASPAGGRIVVGVDGADGLASVLIDDEGDGLPFEPQPTGLEPGPTTKRMGTGLGIPVAFKVCKAHGWILEFKGAPGGGARVRLSGPIDPAVPQALALAPEPRESTS